MYLRTRNRTSFSHLIRSLEVGQCNCLIEPSETRALSLFALPFFHIKASRSQYGYHLQANQQWCQKRNTLLCSLLSALELGSNPPLLPALTTSQAGKTATTCIFCELKPIKVLGGSINKLETPLSLKASCPLCFSISS